ncbi:hypothetical protein C8J56DRAFT_1064621 [Mycena floridula]|nr:hypothetical protein C8J56DRAFT_1064621 [Mycena floridula]
MTSDLSVLFVGRPADPCSAQLSKSKGDNLQRFPQIRKPGATRVFSRLKTLRGFTSPCTISPHHAAFSPSQHTYRSTTDEVCTARGANTGQPTTFWPASTMRLILGHLAYKSGPPCHENPSRTTLFLHSFVMIFHNLSVSLFLSLLARVVAHGPGAQVTLDGHAFPGILPAGSQPVASIVRLVSSGDSKKGAADPYIDCGNDAQAATAVAPATPGSVLAFKWTGDGFTILGQCSRILRRVARRLAITRLVDRSPATATLSTNLAAGNYLVHHEVIALHNALSIDGAEFYPSCSQI